MSDETSIRNLNSLPCARADMDMLQAMMNVSVVQFRRMCLQPAKPRVSHHIFFADFTFLTPFFLSLTAQDPNIRRMTEAISQDPVFLEMAKELQDSMLAGGMGGLNMDGEPGAEGGAAPGAMPGAMPGMPPMDPAKYMEAMQRVMENPEFLTAAESLGRGLMSQALSPEDQAMLEIFQNPSNQAALKARLETLKEDPELTAVMTELEENGQGAMMKYMNDPEIMSKIGRKFQEALTDPEFRASLEGAEALDAIEAGAGAAGGAAGEEEEEETIITVASAGLADRLKELLAEEGADADVRDEEGRAALHFAAGYGELQCVKVLLDAGADINAVDSNSNTALHYAAGYGDVEAAKLLTERGADVSITNNEGKTAVEVAEMNEQMAVVEALKTV